jgi:hypothetical protein
MTKRSRRIFARQPAAVFAGVAVLCGIPGASAQALDQSSAAARGGGLERPVALERIDILHAAPDGGHYEPGPTLRGCDVTVAHTDADFGGGTFVAQAGFSQGEYLAATYVLPATDFPVKITLLEAIFATVNASEETVTQWSVHFWEGEPNTGNLVASYESDDLILPHLRLGPGTAGANIQFSIDPSDPEQVILSDNGSHQISVAYRIVAHNQPPANPCTTSPAQCCNAFPTTDASGLAQPTRNWLNGLNCGPFGCPANGGWARFSALPGFCRPSGDWVVRASYMPVNCQPGVGPCCVAGACQVRTQTECQQLGGAYQGDGTSCTGITCPPPPTQACCFASTGGCLNLTPANCTGAGGTPGGIGTTCATYNCNQTGACCLPNGSCTGPLSPSACQSQGGVFQGDGTSCGSVNCPQPQGACCFGTFCLVLTQADCATGGGSWHSGQTCADADADGTPDACEAVNCTGDLDNDLDVDIADLAHLLSNFGRQSGATPADGDLDNDQDVDLSDLTVELSNFGRHC